MRTLLYQKRNGAFYLVLWRERQSFGKHGPERNKPSDVTVRFEEPISEVRRYMPTDPDSNLESGNRPRQTYSSPSNLEVEVPDHLVILEIVPRGVRTPGVETSCNFRPS